MGLIMFNAIPDLFTLILVERVSQIYRHMLRLSLSTKTASVTPVICVR